MAPPQRPRRPARPGPAGKGSSGGKRGTPRDREAPRDRDGQPQHRIRPEPPKVKGWGGVARRGAGVVREPGEGTASAAWRAAVDRARGEQESAPRSRPAPEPDVWVDEGTTGRPAPAPRAGRDGGAPGDVPTRAARPRRLPAAVSAELGDAAGRRADKLETRLASATRAYERDRYREARTMLKSLADQAPAAPAVRELYGLTLYRLGAWAPAVKELEAFRTLSGSHDQHPVLADCYRALRRYRKVAEVWEDLKSASPGAELVTEGRIVFAGALADQGRLADAIGELERAGRSVKRPREHHLRLWYALADLYERAGDVPRARGLFARIAAADPEFFDAGPRARALA